MRIGVLGGSFNPPHNGHLIIASDACEALKLDKLLVMPAFANPLKGHDAEGASPEQRLEMTRLAFGGDARFEVSAVEMERGGLSFTVDTLEALSRQYEGAELVLLVGIDALRSLNKWRSPERIRELARLVALSRGPESQDDGADDFEIVTTRRIDISSSEIRSRLNDGKPVRGFVAESVERYITAAKLYRPRSSV